MKIEVDRDAVDNLTVMARRVVTFLRKHGRRVEMIEHACGAGPCDSATCNYFATHLERAADDIGEI